MEQNNEKPLVSILIPFYNDTKYLERALKSIVNQTYKNIETIVIDDCSTLEEAKTYLAYLSQHYNITVIKNEKNEGASKSISTALKICKGKYVGLFAQDDEYMEDKTAFQVQEMQEKNLDAIYCNSLIIDEEKNQILEKFNDHEILELQKLGQERVAKVVAQRDDIGVLMNQGALFLRKVLEDLDWMRGKFLLDDWPITIMVWKNYKVEYNPKVTVKYRVHATNTHKDFWKWFPGRMQVLAELIFEEDRLNTLSRMYFFMGNSFLERKMYEETYKAAFAGFCLADDEENRKLNEHLLYRVPKEEAKRVNNIIRPVLEKFFRRYDFTYKLKVKLLRLMICLIPKKSVRKKMRAKYI